MMFPEDGLFPEAKLLPEGAGQSGADWDRYRRVVDATAVVLRTLFDQVGEHYAMRKGPAFDARAVRKLTDASKEAATVADLPVKTVKNRVTALAWRRGLLVRSSEEGERREWAMPGRPNLTRDEARTIVDEAMRGER